MPKDPVKSVWPAIAVWFWVLVFRVVIFGKAVLFIPPEAVSSSPITPVGVLYPLLVTVFIPDKLFVKSHITPELLIILPVVPSNNGTAPLTDDAIDEETSPDPPPPPPPEDAILLLDQVE